MKTGEKKRKFKLIEINDFDARCGYKRCTPPGVGVTINRSHADSDFWKDHKGVLVVRFCSQGYKYHFKGLLASGRRIPEDKMDDFREYVSDTLLDWMIEGVDYLPNSIYET